MTGEGHFLGIAAFAVVGAVWWLWRQHKRPKTPLSVSYDQIVASVHDAVLVLNAEGYIMGLNPAAQRLLNLPRDILINRRLSSVLTLPPATPLKGAAKAEFEMIVGEKMCEVDSLPLVSRNDVIGRLIVLRDITARKQAEQEALALAFEREQGRILASFIRDASHEFRTPVTVIKTSLYLITRQADPEKRAKQITTVGEQIGRLSRLITDLQKMSLLDSAPTLNRVETDLIPVLHTIADRSSRQSDGRKVRVMTDIPTLVFPFDTDELSQALTRLVDNALRYSLPDTVALIRLKRHGDTALIEIQDSGIGMDADTVRQAPQRFYRNDSAHTTAGFGLGLPIAKIIIELHGGTLTLNSRLGEGTTVSIQLPLTFQREKLASAVQSAAD